MFDRVCFWSVMWSVFFLFFFNVLFFSFYGDYRVLGCVSYDGFGRLFVIEVGSSFFMWFVFF